LVVPFTDPGRNTRKIFVYLMTAFLPTLLIHLLYGFNLIKYDKIAIHFNNIAVDHFDIKLQYLRYFLWNKWNVYKCKKYCVIKLNEKLKQMYKRLKN